MAWVQSSETLGWEVSGTKTQNKEHENNHHDRHCKLPDIIP